MDCVIFMQEAKECKEKKEKQPPSLQHTSLKLYIPLSVSHH